MKVKNGTMINGVGFGLVIVVITIATALIRSDIKSYTLSLQQVQTDNAVRYNYTDINPSCRAQIIVPHAPGVTVVDPKALQEVMRQAAVGIDPPTVQKAAAETQTQPQSQLLRVKDTRLQEQLRK